MRSSVTAAPLTHTSPMGPIRSDAGAHLPLGLEAVTITGGSWAPYLERNARTTIPHAQSWMEKLGWVGNFSAVVDGTIAAVRQGREFSDSDVYKLMEAMAWEIGRTGDPDMERRFQELTEVITSAQESDGYLNTRFGHDGQEPRYSDFEWGHELYCAGHMFQTAVARLRTTGPDAFTAAAVRVADHLCEVFGEGGRDAVGGHPEVETALVELGRTLEEPRYTALATRFLELRGRGLLGEIEFGQQYFQDDEPVYEAAVLRGHSVRALYLAAGAIDAAVEAGDAAKVEAIRAQFDRTLARRTYITGGMGSRHMDESFGEDYELPPDVAYCETCAGVAAIQVAHRLLLWTGDEAYADVIERCLFNVVTASVSAEGDAFFYVNPLHQRTEGSTPEADRPTPRASSSQRAPWFTVSCCPTNIARTLASLPAYVATVGEEELVIHQFVTGTVRATVADRRVELRVATDYPADGEVEVQVVAGAGTWTLGLRVPSWCEGATAQVDGEPVEVDAGAGRLSITRSWTAGEVVTLSLPMPARFSRPDPRIDAVRGQVAVERGPLVHCLESVDLGDDVEDAVLDAAAGLEVVDGQVLATISRRSVVERPWPYVATTAPVLPTGGSRQVRLQPYREWGNRGAGTMRVFLPTD
ncbi:glycoside hydrolase family 127 protein [Brachybacterium saurashtrense]|uniref:Glycoside hydrolase family 127 protein n=1 Tax=Brachybacterium saurashtrense TaxID=556288 RepID=A0A345YS43_9MICO|nr:glycoside hydrolase family 127 protein [Brachybacterium saurashtrense]RRR22460.1 glycoside hydrolase family 127 protein [Brachybacterium saurashtrense]